MTVMNDGNETDNFAIFKYPGIRYYLIITAQPYCICFPVEKSNGWEATYEWADKVQTQNEMHALPSGQPAGT